MGKVTYLESSATEVFFAFVRHVRTQTWFSYVELSKATYSGKPTDGDRRTVTIWQGSKNSCYQKLEVHFFYNSDFGGWNLNGVIFSGVSVIPDEGIVEWSQAFRGGPRHDDPYTWSFTPVRYDGRYFRDYQLSDPAENEEFANACKKRFPRTKVEEK